MIRETIKLGPLPAAAVNEAGVESHSETGRTIGRRFGESAAHVQFATHF
jgi:hypothetical protein